MKLPIMTTGVSATGETFAMLRAPDDCECVYITAVVCAGVDVLEVGVRAPIKIKRGDALVLTIVPAKKGETP